MTEPVSLQVKTITPEIIAFIRQTIIDAIQPQQIILFGSYAHDSAEAGSDLDLLIVHNSSQSNRQIRRRIDRLFLRRRFGLDLLVRTPAEIRKNIADNNPFYTKHIFGEGIVLYEQ